MNSDHKAIIRDLVESLYWLESTTKSFTISHERKLRMADMLEWLDAQLQSAPAGGIALDGEQWTPVQLVEDTAYSDVVTHCIKVIQAATRQWGMPEVQLVQRSPTLAATQSQSIRVCVNIDCRWVGYDSETVYLDGIEPLRSLCPQCNEVTEEMTPGWAKILLESFEQAQTTQPVSAALEAVPDGPLGTLGAHLRNRTIFVPCTLGVGVNVQHGYTLADNEYLVQRPAGKGA